MFKRKKEVDEPDSTELHIYKNKKATGEKLTQLIKRKPLSSIALVLVIAFLGIYFFVFSHAATQISLVGAAKGGDAGSTTTLSIVLPTGIQANDQIIATVQTGSGTTLTTPTGWNLVSNYVASNSGETRLYVYSKTAAGNETSFSVYKGGYVGAWGSIAVYRGVNPTSPIDQVSSTTGNGTSISATAITTSVVDEQLVLAEGATLNSSAGSFSAPNKWTQELTSNVQWSGSGLADVQQASAGSTGSPVATFNASANLVVTLIGLRPATTSSSTSTSTGISIVGTAKGGNSGSTTSLNFHLPAGIKANDQIIVAVQSGFSTTITTPTGWTQVSNYVGPNSGYPRLYIFRKTATGSETSFVANKGGYVGAYASAVVYRGVNTINPIDQISTESAGGASITIPAITASVSGEQLVLAEAADNNSTNGTWTAPSGWTQELNSNVKWGSSAIADKNLTSTGTSGSPTATFNSSAALDAVLLGLRPASTSAVPVDTTPPTAPTNLTGSAVSTSQINLTWTASTDNVGVTGYNIYINGSKAGTSTNTSFSATGLIANTSYAFYVTAYDAAGNVSVSSNAITVNTQSVVSGGGNTSSSILAKLGVYAGPTNIAGVNSVGTLLGHQIPYAMDFLNGTSWATITANTYPLQNWLNSGYSMIWGVDILPGTYSPDSNISNVNGSAYGLSQGAAGNFNGYFKTVAQNMVSDGYGNSIIRLGWEFNGGWFPWAANGSAANFVLYWQNIVNSMRSVTGQHFLFEWNPTLGDQGVGDLATYYPGNNYVDIIGEDVYDVNWNNYPGCTGEWQVMLNETYGLNWFASFAAQQGKQMAFPEWGLGFGTAAVNCGTLTNTGGQTGGGDDAYFVQQMVNYINTHNFIEATVWDEGSGAIPNTSQYPNATAAFVSGF